MVVGKYFRMVRRGSTETYVFIMCHEDLSKKELYATKRIVHITEEVPKEDLLDL